MVPFKAAEMEERNNSHHNEKEFARPNTAKSEYPGPCAGVDGRKHSRSIFAKWLECVVLSTRKLEEWGEELVKVIVPCDGDGPGPMTKD
jgi:hypothetical protein